MPKIRATEPVPTHYVQGDRHRHSPEWFRSWAIGRAQSLSSPLSLFTRSLLTTLAVSCSSPGCFKEFRAAPQFHVQIQAHRATWDARACRDSRGPAENQFSYWAGYVWKVTPDAIAMSVIWCLSDIDWCLQSEASVIRCHQRGKVCPSPIQ